MQRIKIEKPISQLTPLDVTCSTTLCNEGFHFHTSSVIKKGQKKGDCKDCGDNSIDWDRIHAKNPDDIQYTFDSLKKELLRHVCWVNEVDDTAIEFALSRGKDAILKKASEIISKKIAKIPTGHWDYKCTPKQGKEIINYAQHATATCCRKCLDRWHNIPENKVLTSEQIKYCVDLIELYVNDRIPNLLNEPSIPVVI
jgi:hypothetical protein